MDKENKPINDVQRAETFRVEELIGKSWDDINYIINKNKKNGFIMQKIADSAEFKDYVQQQAKKFLNHQVALRERDVKAASILWLHGDLELEEIQEINARLEKKEYIASDKFRDLTTDKTFQVFAEHIEEIHEEMEMPVIGFENLRINQRQKIIDYIRFMEGGNKSKEMFEKDNWKFFQNEFDNFPKMRTPFIIELHHKSAEKDQNSDRFKMMNRILYYRFEDIHSGSWKLGDEEELAVLENFANENSTWPESSKILEDVKACREQKAARLKEKEEKKKAEAEAAAKIAPKSEEEKIVRSQKEKPIIETSINEKSDLAKPIIKKAEPLIIDEFPNDEAPFKTKSQDSEGPELKSNKIIEEKSDKPKATPIDAPVPDKTDKPEKEEKPDNSGDVKKVALPEENKTPIAPKENDSEKEKTSENKIKAEDKEEDKEPENWQDDTYKLWRNWGKANRKWVATYQNEDNSKALSFKVYAHSNEVESDNFEADITYHKHNHLVVKGKDGKVPNNAIFDGIIEAAKEGSKQISFGNIKNDEFKARLMLACLCDPEIEMINAPKIEDLNNLPADLLEALKNPGIRKAEKAKEKKEMLERQKKFNDGKKPYNKDNSQPRHEYTDEEKKAYRERNAAKRRSYDR